MHLAKFCPGPGLELTINPSAAIFAHMIRSDNSARFTLAEVDEFRQIGLDLSKVRDQDDIEQEVSRWAHTLADERFALLEKIASAMAKAKGMKLPPKLNVVPSADSSR